MNDDFLGIEEFKNELLDSVSSKIVSRTYLYENSEFVDALIFDLFSEYLKGSRIKLLSDMFEYFFFNLFEYTPSVVNSLEILDTENYF